MYIVVLGRLSIMHRKTLLMHKVLVTLHCNISYHITFQYLTSAY